MMEGEGAKIKQTRKGNFSESELRTLVSQFAQNKTLLQSKYSSTVTNQKKAKVWGNITTALNATGTVPRTVDNVKKKWLELKRNGVTFSSARKRPKTGGGPPPEEPWYVEYVLDIVGEKSAILGLKVGTFLILFCLVNQLIADSSFLL